MRILTVAALGVAMALGVAGCGIPGEARRWRLDAQTGEVVTP